MSLSFNTNKANNSWKRQKKWKGPQTKPHVDRAVFDVLHAIVGRKATEVASHTYVRAQTIRNWRTHKVRHPQHHTLNAVAEVAGLEFRLVNKRTGKVLPKEGK